VRSTATRSRAGAAASSAGALDDADLRSRDHRRRAPRRSGAHARRRANPPYRYAAAFIEHAIELGVDYHAWLLKADFLCAQQRLRLVTELGYPARIWGLTERPDFLGQGGPTMNCAWVVWDGVNRNHSRFELLSRVNGDGE
jgi:hypothetical protein